MPVSRLFRIGPIAGAVSTALAMIVIPATAQQISVAAGLAKVPDQVGDAVSDHGAAVRLGLHWGGERLVAWGFELGYDRFNLNDRRYTTSCLVPGGGVQDCSFRGRDRDQGLSAMGTVRLQARRGDVRPYFSAGLGLLSTRTRSRQEATDSLGNRLPNFEFDGTFTSNDPMGLLGVGLAFVPGGGSLALTAEGRFTPVLHNYSGAPALSDGVGLLLGIRWSR